MDSQSINCFWFEWSTIKDSVIPYWAYNAIRSTVVHISEAIERELRAKELAESRTMAIIVNQNEQT